MLISMKGASSLNTNKEEYLECKFHLTVKKQIIFRCDFGGLIS